mgnify:CR=1 FL=1
MNDVSESNGFFRRMVQVNPRRSARLCCICRVPKTMLVNINYIISVRPALNGRLYAKMENGEEILITRKYAKEIAQYFMEEERDERI